MRKFVEKQNFYFRAQSREDKFEESSSLNLLFFLYVPMLHLKNFARSVPGLRGRRGRLRKRRKQIRINELLKAIKEFVQLNDL